jgi:hypothetical protein
MTILAAIRREERKLEKQLSKLQHRLNGVRTAASALGHSTSKELTDTRRACYPLLEGRRSQLPREGGFDQSLGKVASMGQGQRCVLKLNRLLAGKLTRTVRPTGACCRALRVLRVSHGLNLGKKL